LSRARRTLSVLLAFTVFAGLVQPGVAQAAPPRPAVAKADQPADETTPRPMPPDPYKEWDGSTGVPDWGDPRLRQIVVDNAELDEDREVRDAAAAALAAGTNAAVMAFLNQGYDAAKAQAQARKDATARDELARVQALRGTGGPYRQAEVERVLAGTPSDRTLFLAYGKDIADQRDAETSKSAQQVADQNRARVQMLVGAGGPAVQRAAQAALDGGDAAIATFLNTGYLAAAKVDADAREQQIKDEEARNKAAGDLSDLARKAARAAQARRDLLVAHGNGVRALEKAANALVSAGAEARKAAAILSANAAGGQHPTDAFDIVKAEVARQLGYAEQAASEAQQASAAAKVQADILVDTGLTYGTQWAQIAVGMANAAQAAASASETAQHAIDATAFTDQARNAQEQAERHAEEAHQWRLHAEEHAKAAAQIAEAARVQADAAKDAAARTKAARQAAEAAEAQAWAAAERTRQARITAEREAANAAAARATAQRESAAAASARARADQQAAVAHTARAEADRQAGIASTARQAADSADGRAAQLDSNARGEEKNAADSRDRAYQAERDQRAAEARAAALDAMAAAARGGQYEKPAQDAANEAHGAADSARNAAGAARGAANTATGAASGARAAATEAGAHAARARAAAQQAAAAAARANAAANKAEAEAAATHAARLKSDAAAADATLAETQAAEAARNAVALAEQASNEAIEAARSAERTKAEADAAAAESVSAATQAGLAVQAASAARASSSAITDPANTAITVTAPFSGSDLGADFVQLVASQALAVGAEQAAAAQQRATEALDAARLAQEAADRAAGEVKPAFDASAAAAHSAAAAAKSAAEAQQSAAEAAVDGAAARAAATRSHQADAQAHDDAVRARAAANAASNDAAIAGRAASSAEHEAAAARAAASAAETDAAAAQASASHAESEATAAESAAADAQTHADNVAQAARNAMQSAVDAGHAADRAEQAERDRQAADRAKQAEQAGKGDPGIDADEEEMLRYQGGDEAVQEYKDAMSSANKGIIDFIKENGADVVLELIGVKDAQRCFGEGDIVSCLWTVVNAASLIALIAKIPAVASAIAKVAGGVTKFLEGTAAGERILEKVRDVLSRTKGIPCNCFPAGTSVSVAQGAKPIESIHVGDQVWARDLTTGQSQLRTVIGLFAKRAEQILNFTVDGTRFQVTPQHPFWLVGHGWTQAGDIHVGDRLQSKNGTQPVVAAITVDKTPTIVYNFEVEGDHNYYISPSQLLVHNCDVHSLIKNDASLVKAAEQAGKDPQVQKELDDLVGKFMQGNKNPGIGTATLTGTGLSYLRGRNGGRVFFRVTERGMEIVAKASKDNEQSVINTLTKLYGN
jgi:hypothetical protein